MTTNAPTRPVPSSPAWLGPAGYLFFLGLAAVALLRAEIGLAAMTLWTAAVFDPFAASGAWTGRGPWRKAVLYAHVIAAFAASAAAFLLNR